MKFSLKIAVLAAVLAVAASSVSFAEPPNLSGFLETTYNYNFNTPMSRVSRFRSFDGRANSFILNAFELKVDGTMGEDAGYVSKVLVGSDAKVITDVNTQVAGSFPGNGAADDVDLHEGYFWYKAPIGDGLTVTVGKFVTYEGIEVIEGKDDYTVSRGFLFGLAEPFTHTGAKIHYPVHEKVDVGVGVVNGWDAFTDNNKGKTFITRLGLNFGDPFSGGIQGYFGPEKDAAALPNALSTQEDDRYSFDATFFTKFMEKLTVGWQFNYGGEKRANVAVGATPAGSRWAHWVGFGIQPKVDITDKFWLGARVEYFDDQDGARTGLGGAPTPPIVIKNFTLAPAYKVTDSVTVQAEWRYDWANKAVFENESGAFNKKQQHTMALAFRYLFGG